MRRKDREITEDDRIDGIIRNCHCCRLGLADEGGVYIVPMNFGYISGGGRRLFYFHGAKEGRKIDLIRKSHEAGFELDTGYRLHEGETACSYSAAFQSVIGTGRVDIVEGAEEKRMALGAVMGHSTGKDGWDFTDAALEAVCVLKLEVREISCKEHG